MGAINKKRLDKGQRGLEKPGTTATTWRRNSHRAATLLPCPRPQVSEHRQGKDACPNAGHRDQLTNSRAWKPADSLGQTAASTWSLNLISLHALLLKRHDVSAVGATFPGKMTQESPGRMQPSKCSTSCLDVTGNAAHCDGWLRPCYACSLLSPCAAGRDGTLRDTGWVCVWTGTLCLQHFN